MQEMILKRAADLAEALYSLPPRGAGHQLALTSSPAAAAAAGPAGMSQLTLAANMAPSSPASASASPAVAATHLPSVTAGFNGYAGHAGDYQQGVAWDDSWTHRYHQAFTF